MGGLNEGQETTAQLAERIAGNIEELYTDVAQAAERSGRDLEDVLLVAVSKTVGPNEIRQAIRAGLTDFAENRSNLFRERADAFPDVNWHFIGRIQTNKVKDFTGRATLVHSVASDRVLLAIEQRAQNRGILQPVLIEVNVSGEESKDGVSVEELPGLLHIASALQAVSVNGLMTMAPIGDADIIRRCFRKLHGIREKMQSDFSGVANLPLTELSMGMSDDFLIAVEEGATMIRIGRSVWK